MKIKVWTVLYKLDSEIGLATGGRNDEDGNYVYSNVEELLEDLGKNNAVSSSYEEAVEDGNRFWIECVEVEL